MTWILSALALLSTGCRLGIPGGPADVTEQRKPADGQERRKAAKSEKRTAAEHAERRAPGSDRAEEIRVAREQAGLVPDEPYWPYRVGQLSLEADSLENAEAALLSSLQRDRSYAPALSLLSKIYYHTRRHQQAIDRLEPLRQTPGGLPPLLLQGLALHYDAMGRTDVAAGLLAGTSDRDRGDAGSAMTYLSLRAAADTTIRQAKLRADSKSAVAQNNLGIARLRSGDPAAARKAFLAAIELDPKLPGPYYNLTILEKFYALDDAAAAGWFRLYRQRSSEDPDGLAELFGAKEPKVAGKGESE